MSQKSREEVEATRGVVSLPIASRFETRDSRLWLNAGSLSTWRAVIPRSSRRLDPAESRCWLVLTEVADPVRSETARRWLDLQRRISASCAWDEEAATAPSTWPMGQPAVFWRLAINRSAIALGARASSTLDLGLAHARRAVRRAAELEVALGFGHEATGPDWVVHDRGEPVLLGLDGVHLVLARPGGPSLLTAVEAAQVQRYVHRAGS